MSLTPSFSFDCGPRN